MVLWSLFRDVDVEEITRQLVPCVWTITRHPAVDEYFTGFRGRLVGPSSTEHAQQLLDFIENRKSDEKFIRRVRQALDRQELKGILRTDPTAYPSLLDPSGSMIINRSTNTHLDEQERQTRELQKIANWLSPLNFKATQIDHLQKRHGDSGKWFLERQVFKDWRDGGPGMLWCPGSPGAGKTVLSAIIIDHLRTVYTDDDVSITWIYCNYKERTEQTLRNLIGSLLKQMIQNKSSISNNIKALYERHNLNETRPPLGELEQAINLELSTYSNGFLVVDAVDECPEHTGTQAELLRVLETFSETVKVLVTSRDVPTIAQWFEDQKVIRIHARDEDIRKYVQGRINGTRQRHLKSLESDIVNQVAERAEGMFLLARLFMDLIVTKVSHAGVRKVLEDMPKGIDEIYANALQRIREQDGDRRQLGEQVLKWITFAFRPLSLEELQAALAIVQESTKWNQEAIINEEILTSACAGLVSIDKGSDDIKKSGDFSTHGTVCLIHYTAQSYFERTKTVHFPGAHKDIAKACITYLSQEELLGVQVPDIFSLQDLKDHHHLLHYASNSWGYHVQEQSDKECDEMVHQFLEDERMYLLSGQILDQGFLTIRKGFSGIHLSAYFGLEHIIQGQLLNGADLGQTDNRGQTPLVLAAIEGHEKVVEMLLAQLYIDANVSDYHNWMALLSAAKAGHVKVVKLLLGQPNVTPNLIDEDGRTSLLIAVKSGHVKVVELLLTQQNVETNLADMDGTTPLIMAATLGHVKIVEMLLEHPYVDISLTDGDGLTPMLRAVKYGHVRVVELLLKQPNIAGNLSNEFQAAKPKYVKLLVDEIDLEVYLTDNYDLTPLYLAAENQQWKMMEFLLDQPNIAVNDFQLSDASGNVSQKLDISLSYKLEHESYVACMCFSADGNFLATSCNHIVEIYDMKTGMTCDLMDKDMYMGVNINHLCFSPDRQYLAAGGRHSQDHHLIWIWDIACKSSIWQILEGHESHISSINFSWDGCFIVSSSWDRTTCIWDMETGKEHMKFCTEDEDGFSAAAFSPNGQLVATRSDYVDIYDTQSGVLIESLDHGNIVFSVAFTPDGKGLVSGGFDGILKLWDMSPLLCSPPLFVPLSEPRDCSECEQSEKSSVSAVNFVGHKKSVHSVAVSHDGRWVVSGSFDGSVRFWDLHTRQTELLLWGHEDYVNSLHLSPTSGLLATTGDDGWVKVWRYTWGKRKGVADIEERRVRSRVD